MIQEGKYQYVDHSLLIQEVNHSLLIQEGKYQYVGLGGVGGR